VTPRVAVSRRYRFPAAHVLRRPEFSDAQNERIWGKCANPAGHGHNYGVEVTVAGPVEPATGQVVDPDWLDALVRERVLERLGHRLLNDDPAFRELVPTAEHIARFVEGELDGPVAERGGLRLVRVRVVETRRNVFETGELE
jgi:6-pyruvoyltetrahydropterin/6-carboxytetrahydropterin synthase